MLLLPSFSARILVCMALMWCILPSWSAHAQLQSSDVFSSSGSYDPYAVGGAHKWYDNHSTEFKEKSSHCLLILDEAKVYQDKALALYKEASHAGNSKRQSELVKQANEQIALRSERLRAFTDCVNQANRRPMLEGRVEQNEAPSDQQPGDDKDRPPKRPKVKVPPPKKVPPPPDRGPEQPVPLPTPLPPDTSNRNPPSGTPSQPASDRYKFGKPDPPFMFADGISKGMSDCFAENLPMDMATAPLAVLKRLERLKKAVEVVGKAGSVYAIYEDIKAYDPTADPYEVGKWLGKLICDGKDLRDVIKQRKKPPVSKEPPVEPSPKQPSDGEHQEIPPSQDKPPPQDAGPFTSKTHFPSAPDPLKRGMPLEDHKQLVKLAVDKRKIIVVRDSNPWAMRWVGRPRHIPKPQELKAKTIPYDPAKSAADNQFAGLASAQGLPDADRRALLQKGYTIRGKDQIIVDPKGNRMYSDTDLHGVYDIDGKDAWSDGLRQEMNNSFLENMVQHGPQDNWPDRNNLGAAGPNAGPKPPVTAYLPDGTTQHMTSIDQMKQFYTANGIDWKSIYPSY